jgi:hypothetical protein
MALVKVSQGRECTEKKIGRDVRQGGNKVGGEMKERDSW